MRFQGFVAFVFPSDIGIYEGLPEQLQIAEAKAVLHRLHLQQIEHSRGSEILPLKGQQLLERRPEALLPSVAAAYNGIGELMRGRIKDGPDGRYVRIYRGHAYHDVPGTKILVQAYLPHQVVVQRLHLPYPGERVIDEDGIVLRQCL